MRAAARSRPRKVTVLSTAPVVSEAKEIQRLAPKLQTESHQCNSLEADSDLRKSCFRVEMPNVPDPTSSILDKRSEYGSAYLRGRCSTVRFLISRGVSYDTAEELAQAAWVKGWERLNQLRDPQLLNSWVNSIALNLQRGNCRRHVSLPLRDMSEHPHWDLKLDVEHALESLRAEDRRRIEKRYFEGLDIREIAHSEGSTEGAVRIRLLRSRRVIGRALVS